MKKSIKILTILLVLCLAITMFASCTKTDKKYYKNVSNYSFWDNKGSEAVPQYQYYHIMKEFLANAEIVNNQFVDKDGKVLKIFFAGMDGVRADALTNVFYDANSKETNGYNYPAQTYSGLNKLKSKGGLYLSYSGGEKGKDSEQSSSTCSSWTSELTGGWNNLHGVKNNDDNMVDSVDTIMMEYAKKGISTSFAFDWGDIFDVTFKKEVNYILQNKDLPIKYCDINRPYANNEEDVRKNEKYDKKTKMKTSLEAYNAVSNDNILPLSEYDIAMKEYLSERIEKDSIVVGIFHAPDSNGHNYGFTNSNAHYVNSLRNSDNYLYELLLQIEKREIENNEKWLVIATTDHGGNGNGHGKQIYEMKTTWFATNYKIDTKYYGKNYDGYKEN